MRIHIGLSDELRAAAGAIGTYGSGFFTGLFHRLSAYQGDREGRPYHITECPN